jgi:MFS superfamily sulfate permease-like transporter
MSKVIALHEAVFLLKHHKFDFMQFSIAFLAVFAFGTDRGLYMCLALSFVIVLKTASKPSVIFQNLLKESSLFKDKNFLKLIMTPEDDDELKLEAINVRKSQRTRKNILVMYQV